VCSRSCSPSALPRPADALGHLPCGSEAAADTVDIGTGPLHGNGIFLIVAGTSELLGGSYTLHLFGY
jgi:hypothetical protein